jgi:MOSC domain-containing protein YiiM
MDSPFSAMFEGRLESIYIGPIKQADLQPMPHSEAVPGRGLRGDRYYLQQGTFSKPGQPDREVTLIEIEAIEALERECKLTLHAGGARRNLVTRGVPLNHLVGQEFQVGEVVLRGIRLCEPCGHLESLTVKGVKDGLCHRGGLRAQILRGGILRAGDVVRPIRQLTSGQPAT